MTFPCDIQVIHHVKVFQTVAVGVKPNHAGAPGPIVNLRLPSDVIERAVTVVDQQHVRAEIGEVQIGKAITVEITGGHSLTITIHGAVRGKCARFELVAVDVPVQLVPGARLLRIRIPQGASIHGIQIHSTIAIEVEPGDPAPHDLR